MSTSSPEQSTISAPESQPKRIAEPIYTYTVSWRWLVAGLIGVFGFGGIVGAVHYLQAQNMPTKIVAIAQSMIDESEREKTKMAETNDSEERGRLFQRSLKLRSDAADLLNNYRRANPEETGEAILGKLYDILESLYRDHGEGSSAIGIRRGEQLSELAAELARSVDESRSIGYRLKLLELAWDRRIFVNIIERAKDLYNASVAQGEKDNYEAMRFIAMAFFDRLPIQPYDPLEYQLPTTFSETMDELLQGLNSRKPDDIEVARRYAEFLVSVNRTGRENYTASASDLVQKTAAADLIASARNRIDVMVQLKKDDPAAYLARYHFLAHISQFTPSNEAIDLISPDLQRVLELDPGSAEGLVLSSLHALRQAGIARRGGELERALQWESEAEKHLRHSVSVNPGDPTGYLYLGMFLLDKEKPREAISVWSDGLKNLSHRSGNEELVARLIMLLLQQGMLDEAKGRLNDFARMIDEMRTSRPDSIGRAQYMQMLLNARLYNTEANVAFSRIEAAVRENRLEDARLLYGIVQQKRAEAVQEFEKVLRDFGSEEDYVIERRSVYYLLVPQSLLQLAQLKLDTGEPDKAATYFRNTLRFEEFVQPALIGMSVAYQQLNQLDRAAQALENASRRFPENMSIRYTYAMVLFRSQVGSNAATSTSLDGVQKELESLEQFRGELQQPWVLDIRLIHLGVARANLSNSADTILEAMNDAVRKFRDLEQQTFPPDAEGKTRKYMDDPAFVAELVGIYSSLAARADFDRLLEVLRGFPEGEDAYYEARINDALRRDSRNEAIEVIDEAVESPRLSQTRKEQFVGLLRNLKGENVDNASALDRAYSQLKTTFDENPETLRPQAFFMLAELSLDRGELERARQIKDRLEKLEGQDGTNWRYIEVRLMLAEADPDFPRMRERQEEVVRHRPDWDRSYILSALIEERYLEMNPGDVDTREKLITAYGNAIRRCQNKNTDIWQRYIRHMEDAGRTDDVRTAYRDAALYGVPLESRTGQLPQPYGRMYADVQNAIANEDPVEADAIARQCIRLAEIKGERDDWVFTLHLMLGKAFLDSGSMYESAIRHLSETAKRGGTYVYPLALCVAKSGDVDGGFTLLLDEIDFMPSAMPTLLPAVLVLLAQVQPSEDVFKRIDSLMDRLERGRRLTLRGTLEPSDEKDHVIPLGTTRVESRRVTSIVVRFPENTDNLDPAVIQFFAPEDLAGEEPDAEPVQ